MHIYKVIMLNQEYDGEDHFVVAKSEESAKQLVIDYPDDAWNLNGVTDSVDIVACPFCGAPLNEEEE